MKISYFVSNYVFLLYHKCHRINFERDGSYIDPHDWVKNKKASINFINTNDNKRFHYSARVA